MVFHSKSNYHYHFIISEPTKKFEEEFICLEENTEKNKIFSVPVRKEVYAFGLIKMEKKLQNPCLRDCNLLIAHIMASSLSDLVDHLLMEFVNLNPNMATMIKNVKLVELNKDCGNKDCECYLEYTNVKDEVFENLKLVSAIFYQIYIFSPNDSPLKTMKNIFYFI